LGTDDAVPFEVDVGRASEPSTDVVVEPSTTVVPDSAVVVWTSSEVVVDVEEPSPSCSRSSGCSLRVNSSGASRFVSAQYALYARKRTAREPPTSRTADHALCERTHETTLDLMSVPKR
jgi:hypothetical protein